MHVYQNRVSISEHPRLLSTMSCMHFASIVAYSMYHYHSDTVVKAAVYDCMTFNLIITLGHVLN